jgi:hypothetical protein
MHLINSEGVIPMRVAVNVLGSAKEPRMQVHHEQILATLLRPGSVEVGLRRFEMTSSDSRNF